MSEGNGVTPATGSWDKPWKGPFLTAFESTGLVTQSATAAGISRVTAYRARKSDPAFDQAWASVEDAALDRIEAKAHALAEDGSERMIEFILTHRRPEQFRRRVEVDSAAERERRELEQKSDEELDSALTGLDNVTPITKAA